MSDDRLTVCETRELLTESLSRAHDCAAALVQEVSERDATITRLAAELAEARAALLVTVPECHVCGNPATTYTSDHSYVATAALHLCDRHRSGRGADLPHAKAIRASWATR